MSLNIGAQRVARLAGQIEISCHSDARLPDPLTIINIGALVSEACSALNAPASAEAASFSNDAAAQ